ncbi:sodium:calcium antiporter [Nitratidesulfovibrio sp. SRB-5]|uniref:sodium:calcium antiporter n=1 Tax=Nitratidesulfovibrio sp. SRB-5 TaxID=2872636 RepID=UPI0010287816|nr:sodium:calcium antiporter [Nitratidesulfovibrio sp. SRB-5]MBZ2172690.1 sodium:calcium antiporter [Nitratidesulfovibrio sp. SRB-5]RXF77257.1 sodium:calcium antiporter [Desulfovibrio sp. DS-1]
MKSVFRDWYPFLLAILATLPGLAMRALHPDISPLVMVGLTGGAILASSFMLMWACEVAQLDIPQTLALAVVALIAVLPEYAVDMYFTWMAGQHPESDYAHYAIANMTGANRLLIGVGWSAIVLVCWMRFRSAVVVENERRTDLVFLAMATAYAFFIPIKGSLAWYDGVILVSIYAWYIWIVSRRPCTEFEAEGPAETLAKLSRGRRRLATLSLFLYAAVVILADAELFSESLVASGKVLGINEFLLVQWLAPIASEAPEFIVSLMFALRGHASIALGSLISSKLNQWTLLVGMIPGVYAASSGSVNPPIPMDSHQMNEILLTAAQSLFAICLLLRMRIGIRGALLLFGLFLAQFISPFIQAPIEAAMGLPHIPDRLHIWFSLVYVVLAGGMLLLRPRSLLDLRYGFRV